MRLDFNVLWVDDQPDRIKSRIDAIAKRMAMEGFNFNPTICRSLEDVRGRICDNVFLDEVDLILVDWDLGNELKGQQVIREIREKLKYKDVVFYSALTEPDKLRQAAYDEDLEGVYCVARDDIVEEVIGVFESLVKKVLDLDHTRGIVMGATSDIDHIVNECLLAANDQLDGDGKRALAAEALKHMDRHVNEMSKLLKKLEGAQEIGEFAEAHMLLTSFDRLRLLSGVLKIEQFRDHKEYRQKVVQYMSEVVPGRTMLAHKVMVPEGAPAVVVSGKGQRLSVEQARELRKLILDLRTDFRDLLSALKPKS